jgi:putative ABC transport system permease protein
VLRIASATLRTRWVSFAGAFLALVLGTGVATVMITTLAATSSTPFPGPQRFAAAPTVVVPDKSVLLTVDGYPVKMPVQRPGGLPETTVTQLATTGRTVSDRTFPVHLGGGSPDQVGHAWSAAAFTPYRLIAGRAPTANNEIVIGGGDPKLVNRQVRMAAGTGGGIYTVTGVTALVWFEHAIFFTDTAAARISAKVDAVVAYGPVDAVRRAASSGGTRVLIGDARHEADPDPSGGKDQLSDAEAMAGTSAILGICVAVFVVMATFAFVTAQRRRELALLRTVGATPRQVRRMVATEAVLIGAVASALGSLLGTLGTSPLNTWMIEHDLAPSWFAISVRTVPLIVAFAIGLSSAVIGAVAASWRVARVRPTEALRDAAVDQKVMTAARWLIGVGLLAIGAYMSITTATDSPGDALSVRDYLPVFLPLIGGFALLAPVILKPVAWLSTWPLGRMGAGPMVVRENALTARRRTSATVAPIVLALGLAASILCVQATADDTHNSAVRRQTRAQFVVVPTETTELDRRMVAAVRGVPGADITEWTSIRIRLATAADAYIDTLDAEAVNLATLTSTQNLTVTSGSLSQLGDDSLVIDDETARRNSLHTGDRIKAFLPDGTAVPVRVAAEIKTGVSEETVYLSAAHAAGGPSTRIDVTARPGTTPAAVGAALRAVLRAQDARVAPIGPFLDAVRSRQQQETRQAITVIVGVALLYSFIAIANTMVMAAMGRRREIAALSLAGTTRRQALWFIAAESLLVVMIGAILATVAAAAVIASQRAALIRFSADVPVSIPWMPIGEVTAACCVVALAASVLSTWRMLQGRLVELAGIRE